jgi:hypothetical protein
MILTRTLEYTSVGSDQPRRVTVSIGEPEPDPLPGGDYRVRLEIAGFDKPYDQYFHGVDPIQALIMALWIVPDVIALRAGREGRVTWLGSEALGFRYGDRLSTNDEESAEGPPPQA